MCLNHESAILVCTTVSKEVEDYLRCANIVINLVLGRKKTLNASSPASKLSVEPNGSQALSVGSQIPGNGKGFAVRQERVLYALQVYTGMRWAFLTFPSLTCSALHCPSIPPGPSLTRLHQGHLVLVCTFPSSIPFPPLLSSPFTDQGYVTFLFSITSHLYLVQGDGPFLNPPSGLML
ncbi:Uncharacterized protein HZ326_1342 [Fusarium oxysporum f. sp. albedinis]|nr:Uncharacterized protein HZ326_1342 [Fusarium oxysporum f. sp. albedinis]